MTDKSGDWDAFWRVHNSDPLEAIADPTNWGGLSWKVSLESWEDLFSRLAPGRRLLECGCGSAVLSRYMAQRGYDCTLLDYSAEGIRIARSGFRAKGWDGRFVMGDMNRLPLRDEEFDIVFSGGVIEFFDDIERPIREMIRVLRPGGLFAANMVPRKFSVQTIADWQRTLAHSLRNLVHGKFMKAFTRVKLVPDHYNVNRATLEDYERSCRAGGLSSVVARHTTPFPVFSLPRLLAGAYAGYLRNHLSTWQRFNANPGGWKRWVGITYMVYGIK